MISPEGRKLVLYDKDNCLVFNRHEDLLELRNLYYRNESAGAIQSLRTRIEVWQRRVNDKQALPA